MDMQKLTEQVINAVTNTAVSSIQSGKWAPTVEDLNTVVKQDVHNTVAFIATTPPKDL